MPETSRLQPSGALAVNGSTEPHGYTTVDKNYAPLLEDGQWAHLLPRIRYLTASSERRGSAGAARMVLYRVNRDFDHRV